jgi:O-antigen/teichoic acid export membrane protein
MAWILAQIIVCVLTLILVLQVTRFQVRLNTQLFIRSLSFGIQLHPGNIAQFLNYRLDIFLVGIFLTPTEIGLYATATLLAERLWEIPAAIRTALMFHVSARPEQAINLTTRTCRMIVIITTPVYLGILLFAGTIIPIVFGGDYLPAVKPFILLLPGIWTLSIGRIPAIYLASSGRPIIGTWSAVASLVFTTILDIILIPRIGIAGAAIASSVAYSLSAIIIAYIFIQDTHLPYGQLLIPQNEDWVFMKKIFARTIRATKT